MYTILSRSLNLEDGGTHAIPPSMPDYPFTNVLPVEKCGGGGSNAIPPNLNLWVVPKIESDAHPLVSRGWRPW